VRIHSLPKCQKRLRRSLRAAGVGALGKVDLHVILKSDFNYYYFVSVRFGPFKDDIVTLYDEIFWVLYLGLRVIGLSPFQSEKRAWRFCRWKWTAFLYEKKLKKEEEE
jgi:hypothetical protein